MKETENRSGDDLCGALDRWFCLTKGAPFSVHTVPLNKLRAFAQKIFRAYTSDRRVLEDMLMQVIEPAVNKGNILMYEPGSKQYFWYQQFADRFTAEPRYDLSALPVVAELSQHDDFLTAFRAVGGMINGQSRLIRQKLPLPEDQHEPFVDLLVEAGVLMPLGPNEHGIKGQLWSINTHLFDHVIKHIEGVPVDVRPVARS